LNLTAAIALIIPPRLNAAADMAKTLLVSNSRRVITGSNTVSAATITINWKEAMKIEAASHLIFQTSLKPSRNSK
jgi:hypothetical protein